MALDSTDISTWGRVRYRKPLVDAEPDSPPPPDYPLAPPDPAHPHARRRGHHRPDAPTGADGRCRYTVDPDARMGFGLRRYTLLAGFTFAALNILNLHDWATRREVLGSWGRFLGEPEPERRPRRRRRSTHSATRHAASLAATGPGR
ncbi:hypothetical protein [Rhodococcus pseudokoreensis]|uniref:hypothetical protein n=1 Tax=Rhodococcus pseudokoreensis TaxID=2811421 RepID=UPI001F126317|nr:hypothetical protein [Rhodococcus pseudokoreensis]